MPTKMQFQYKDNEIEFNPSLSNVYHPEGLSVNVQKNSQVECDVYSFGQVDQFGAMALIYIKNPIIVKYVDNIYSPNELIKEQVEKTAILSGWTTTMNRNLIP